MTFLYIATPYSNHPAGQEVAFQEACRATARLTMIGFKAISPIVYGHSISPYVTLDPLDYSKWLDINHALMEASAGIVVVQIPGWRQSRGVAYEIEWFRQHDKPVYFWDMGDVFDLQAEEQ